MITLKIFYIILYTLFILSDKTSCLTKNIKFPNQKFEVKPEYCTDKILINKFKDILLSNDQELYNGHIEEIGSIYQYNEIFNRVKQYNNNVTTKAKPLNKAIATYIENNFSQLLFEKQCFKSLSKITDSIKNGEKWAINCK